MKICDFSVDYNLTLSLALKSDLASVLQCNLWAPSPCQDDYNAPMTGEPKPINITVTGTQALKVQLKKRSYPTPCSGPVEWCEPLPSDVDVALELVSIVLPKYAYKIPGTIRENSSAEVVLRFSNASFRDDCNKYNYHR